MPAEKPLPASGLMTHGHDTAQPAVLPQLVKAGIDLIKRQDLGQQAIHRQDAALI